jgi:hypothetical protein
MLVPSRTLVTKLEFSYKKINLRFLFHFNMLAHIYIGTEKMNPPLKRKHVHFSLKKPKK